VRYHKVVSSLDDAEVTARYVLLYGSGFFRGGTAHASKKCQFVPISNKR